MKKLILFIVWGSIITGCSTSAFLKRKYTKGIYVEHFAHKSHPQQEQLYYHSVPIYEDAPNRIDISTLSSIPLSITYSQKESRKETSFNTKNFIASRYATSASTGTSSNNMFLKKYLQYLHNNNTHIYETFQLIPFNTSYKKHSQFISSGLDIINLA